LPGARDTVYLSRGNFAPAEVHSKNVVPSVCVCVYTASAAKNSVVFKLVSLLTLFSVSEEIGSSHSGINVSFRLTGTQCGGSGMFIPDLDFCPSRIPDPTTATKERGEKSSFPTFLCSHKYHKMGNYFILELLKKQIWANIKRIIETFS
jgi:hypothetical protein